MDGEVGIEMEIAEQGDGEAIHPFGPTREEKILAHEARMVGGQEKRIARNRGGSGERGEPNKFPSSNRGKGQSNRGSLILDWAGVGAPIQNNLRARFRGVTRTMTSVRGGVPMAKTGIS